MTPYFANRTNVSGDAGIAGNNQDPINWGPPRLQFSSGIAGIGHAQAAANSNSTHAGGVEILNGRGRHTLTFGGDVRRQRWNILSQQDARGSFAFTGGATGFDLADFLLGLPHTSAIAFGNADKDFSAPAYDAYVTDDWRVSPIADGQRRRAMGVRRRRSPSGSAGSSNLDVTPGFTARRARSIGNELAHSRTGAGFQPRIGMALRPVAGSSLVVRAGYGIYRNTGVYQPIAMLLAQQPPLSKTLSVENSAANPLTLANGFTRLPARTLNTFAVDPDFRVGYAQNWQVLVQRDLPASLTMTATYLGTEGQPPDAGVPAEHVSRSAPRNPVSGVPVGLRLPDVERPFAQARRSDAAAPAAAQRPDGDGAVHAGEGDGRCRRVHRREHERVGDRAGLAGSRRRVGAVELRSASLLTAQVQYTSGVGVTGGGTMDGAIAKFFKGWTITSQLTTGSGLPLTPVVSDVGRRHRRHRHASARARPALSTRRARRLLRQPAGLRRAGAGQWGNAGRNSITGPRAVLARRRHRPHVPVGRRLNLDWRIDATNVLNRVTYAAVNTIVGSPQFGLPTAANPMRKMQTSLRLRF